MTSFKNWIVHVPHHWMTNLKCLWMIDEVSQFFGNPNSIHYVPLCTFVYGYFHMHTQKGLHLRLLTIICLVHKVIDTFLLLLTWGPYILKKIKINYPNKWRCSEPSSSHGVDEGFISGPFYFVCTCRIKYSHYITFITYSFVFFSTVFSSLSLSSSFHITLSLLLHTSTTHSDTKNHWLNLLTLSLSMMMMIIMMMVYGVYMFIPSIIIIYCSKN